MDHRAYDAINTASGRIANLILERIKDEHGTDAPTVLASAGFITGELLCRLSGQDMSALKPGTPLDNPWLITHGNNLVQVVTGWLEAQGVNSADPGEVLRDLHDQLTPRLEPAIISASLRSELEAAFAEHGIGYEDRMLAAALASVRLILGLREIVAPQIGAPSCSTPWWLVAAMPRSATSASPCPPASPSSKAPPASTEAAG